MRVTFLGTASATPTRRRNVTSVALTLAGGGETWLFDCGEGTQHRLLESAVRFKHLRRLFLTHLHGDHVFGLAGLLSTLSLAGDRPRVTVHGPEGTRTYLDQILAATFTHLELDLEVDEEEGIVFEDEHHRVTTAPLDHRVPTRGYRVEEKPRPGRFDVGAAHALGIPPGPVYGRLRQGERVTLDDGREIDGTTLVGPELRGRVVACCWDTLPCPGAVRLARDADLLVHDATFGDRQAHLGPLRAHSTARQAAQVAAEAGARRLFLTHFSARYGPGVDYGIEELLREAREVFPATEAAEDLLAVDVQLEGGMDDEGRRTKDE